LLAVIRRQLDHATVASANTAVIARRLEVRRGRPSGVVLERQGNPSAVGDDFAVFNLHVELADLSDAQIAQLLGRCLDGAFRCILPRYWARADDFRDTVDAGFNLFLGHVACSCRLRGMEPVPDASGRSS
jgi:hypothetical protein